MIKTWIAVVILSLGGVFGVGACTSLETIQQEIEDVKADFRDDIAEADRMFLAGEITKEQRDELVEQSRQLRIAELDQIRKDAPAILEGEKERVVEAGRTSLWHLAELALLLLLGGGATGAGATIMVNKLKK